MHTQAADAVVVQVEGFDAFARDFHAWRTLLFAPLPPGPGVAAVTPAAVSHKSRSSASVGDQGRRQVVSFVFRIESMAASFIQLLRGLSSPDIPGAGQEHPTTLTQAAGPASGQSQAQRQLPTASSPGPAPVSQQQQSAPATEVSFTFGGSAASQPSTPQQQQQAPAARFTFGGPAATQPPPQQQQQQQQSTPAPAVSFILSGPAAAQPPPPQKQQSTPTPAARFTFGGPAAAQPPPQQQQQSTPAPASRFTFGGPAATQPPPQQQQQSLAQEPMFIVRQNRPAAPFLAANSDTSGSATSTSSVGGPGVVPSQPPRAVRMSRVIVRARGMSRRASRGSRTEEAAPAPQADKGQLQASVQTQQHTVFGAGQPAMSAASPRIGASSTTYPFGQPQPPPSFAFGQPQQQASFAFGQPQQQASFVFGQPQQQASFVFGQPQQQASFVFGQSQHQPSFAFGQPQQPPSFAFGQPQPPPSFAFGQQMPAPPEPRPSRAPSSSFSTGSPCDQQTRSTLEASHTCEGESLRVPFHNKRRW